MNFLDEVRRRKPFLWDGSMGAILLGSGLPPGQAPEGWNLEKPDIIRKIHQAYFSAGSDLVQTNTFGGNRARLADAKCPYSVEEVNRKAVEIAISVRSKGQFVAGNIGPTGLSLPPVGKATLEELEDIFTEQVTALASSGVDLISIETISDLREAGAALKAAKKAATVPVSICLTFRLTKRGFFTVMGNEAVPSLKALLDYGADIVGANCSISSTEMLTLAERLRPEIKGLLLIQPNAGQPKIAVENKTARISYPETPEVYALAMEKAAKIGVDCIGGCCGTLPEHISALAELRKRNLG